MSHTYFIGVDIGTTSTKAIVFSPSGNIQGSSNHAYPILVPQPGWAEQDPEAIFTAAVTAVREAIAEATVSPQAITAVGFSTAMHSLIAVDSQGNLLTNSLIWADNRSQKQTERLQQEGTGQILYLRTGVPIHPMLPLTKLIWMREVDPERFQRAAKFISIKEYVLYRLLNRYVVDYSLAATTGLLNLKQLTWDEQAIAVAGIRMDQLSDVVPTTFIMRGLQPEYATAMGLDPDTPIVIGANDGVLANLGVGAIAPGQVAITVGTSGAVRTVVAAPITHPQGRTFCYPLTPKHWVIGGPTNNGGLVLRWLRDQFCLPEVEQAQHLRTDAYDEMIQAAAQIPAGAEGLLFLPYLTGERAPHWSADVRGVFFGIGLHHQRAHFIRAVLEGIVFNLYSIYLTLQNLMGGEQEIWASGGFARSPVWLQMMADIFGCEVLVPEVKEASGFGAAVLAMYAVGAVRDLGDVPQLVRIRDRHQPDINQAQTYQALFSLYEQLYQTVAPTFTELTRFQRR